MSEAGATRSIADLPGPPGLPLLGNAHRVLDESRGPVKEQLSFTMVPHGLHLRLRERVAGSPMPVGAGA